MNATAVRRACGAAALVTAAVIPAAGAATPSSGWDAPVLVDATYAHRETSIALSPTNPALMATCDPAGVPATEFGQSYFHRSTDGGKTWKFLTVETQPTDSRKYTFEGGDCDVAFDAAGTMYAADTWAGDLSVGHSTDGGNTWDGTALATTSPIVDRPWLYGGPAGTVYVSYQDVQCCMPSAM